MCGGERVHTVLCHLLCRAALTSLNSLLRWSVATSPWAACVLYHTPLLSTQHARASYGSLSLSLNGS